MTRLPFAQPPGRLSRPDLAVIADLKVLVVDDQPANRLVLAQQLEFLGLRPVTADNGASGLQAWMQGTFDAVILDCYMPLMNGFELAMAIRTHERQMLRTPCTLIGYTADTQAQVRARCNAAGMDDCLIKPISLDTLSQRLRRVHPRSVAPRPLFGDLACLTGGDPALTQRLLAEVLASCSRDREDLRALPDDAPKQAFIELAHRIKGAARIVGAREVCAACDAFELATGCDALGPLRDELCQALEALQERVGYALELL